MSEIEVIVVKPGRVAEIRRNEVDYILILRRTKEQCAFANCVMRI